MIRWTLENVLRLRSVIVSRRYKQLFLGDHGALKRSAEQVLVDLRGFCHVDKPTIFSSDAVLMARREGRREVFVRITRMLNLDEAQVQQLMENDDGN